MSEFICIKCPIGCTLSIKDNKTSGARCSRGISFAKQEVITPLRSYTDTVKTNKKGIYVPVKTSGYIPLSKFSELAQLIAKITLPLPVNQGMVIIPNVLSLGVNLVVTKTIKED